MEIIGALVGGGVALVIGLVLGFRWTLGPPWHLIAGLVAGGLCATVYFVIANWVGRTMPGLLDPRLVGLYFLALAVAAPVSGLFGAWFGYRKWMGRSLF